MAGDNTKGITSKQVRRVPNPTGIGGFKNRPQDINSGHWKSEDSISFQYNKLVRLPVDDFLKWKDEHPTNERTVAQEMAYNAVIKARNTDLGFLKEITDRTEGKAVERTVLMGDQENPISLDISSILDKAYGQKAPDKDGADGS